MIIKPATGRVDDIKTLEAILARSDLSGQQRKAIGVELKKVRAGVKGETDAAYQIDFHLRDTKNWMVLHDLRIEVGADVAQIDHVVVNRFMQVFVCETKNFGEGLACNDHGEWVGFYKSRPFGISSPLKQNERHLTVLKRLFKTKHDWHPRRFGLQIAPDMHSFILVSNGARIGRPKKVSIKGMDSVVKVESFMEKVDTTSEKLNPFLAMGGIVGSNTLQTFAEGLAEEHVPITWNWAGKFGLDAVSHQEADHASVEVPAAAHSPETQAEAAAHCDSCGAGVDKKVAWFCRRYKSRFEGKVLCRDCQST
jgi:hypothetical protein